MTRIKDLQKEINRLKNEVKRKDIVIHNITKPMYTRVDIGPNSHVGLIKYLDTNFGEDQYQVQSKVCTKNFIHNTIFDPTGQGLEYVFNESVYVVRDAFIKEAVKWITEKEETTNIEGIKFYHDDNIPYDTVLISPALLNCIECELGKVNPDKQYIISQVIRDIVFIAGRTRIKHG